jgi:hypothetical protein
VGRGLLLFALCVAGCASPLSVNNNDAGYYFYDFSLAQTPDFWAPLPDLAQLDFASEDMVCTTMLCEGNCIDPMNDPNNCGGCGNACVQGQECSNGKCACTPTSCAMGCCSGTTCLPGITNMACGIGGAMCAPCNTSCINNSCGACTPNTMQTTACGNCGTQTRTCDNNGVWGPFGNCMNQGTCAPTTTRTVACGNCGTETDTCSNACQWMLGACTKQGPCAPKNTRTVACGNCGMETDTCSNACQWVAGNCAGQGACAPGDTQKGGCDVCSHVTCNMQCAWGNTCALNNGAACEYKGGTHTRGCACGGGCGGSALQWCLNTCQWSTDCACCTNMCVNC